MSDREQHCQKTSGLATHHKLQQSQRVGTESILHSEVHLQESCRLSRGGNYPAPLIPRVSAEPCVLSYSFFVGEKNKFQRPKEGGKRALEKKWPVRSG